MSENEAINRRNGTYNGKIITNNLFDDAIPIAQSQNSTSKPVSQNKTKNESTGSNTDTPASNVKVTPFTPNSVPQIPSINPIKNEVNNNVFNHVVNPFSSSDSPISSGQNNVTKTQTTKESSSGNSTIDFPDAAPIIGGGTRTNSSATNISPVGVARDNNTTLGLQYNSSHLVNQTFNNSPDSSSAGNLTVGNETKPAISSVFMGVPVPRKEKNITNIVNSTTKNLANSST